MAKNASRRGKAKPSASVVVVDTEGFVERFLDSLRRRNYSPATIKRRRWSLTHYLSFLAVQGVERVQDATTAQLEAYRLSMVEAGWKENTVDANLRSVRLMYDYLSECSLIFENPARGLKLGRVSQPLPEVLSEKQARTLLAAPDVSTPAGLRDRAILEVLYSTGIRRGEAAGLTVFDVDVEKQTVRVLGKGRKERVVPLGRAAAKAVREYLVRGRPAFADPAEEPTDALWLNQYHRKQPAHMLGIIVRTHARAAGLGLVGPHMLRRSCVTHMLKNGAHPLLVAKMLGHAGLKTLSHYLRVCIDQLKRQHRKANPGK